MISSKILRSKGSSVVLSSLRQLQQPSSFSRCAISAFQPERFYTSNSAPNSSFSSNDKGLHADSSKRTLASSPAMDMNEYHKPTASNDNNSSSSSNNHHTGSGKNPIPDFNDAQAAFETKTNAELFRSLLSFGLCQIPILVRNAESMLKVTRAVAGDRVTDLILKQTLFGHFCAGEDDQRIKPTIQKLEDAGIGSILDFAAEDDGSSDQSAGSVLNPFSRSADSSKEEMIADHIVMEEKRPKVRVYDYESEAECDRHVETFKKCIQDVSTLPSDGFAAIKVTALVNPKLLERMSRAIVEAQNLFAKFDANGNGYLQKEEFERGFHLFFKDEDVMFKEMMEELMPTNKRELVDYITWSMLLAPKDLPKITAGCRDVGPLAMAAPTEEEVELIERMYERGHALAEEAAKYGTRLLVDAEQARFQPAIDNLVLELQRKFNSKEVSDYPIIYNTYQCYLKDAEHRLRTDVERSERYDYHFGAKLVRGAYMESERELSKTLGFESPIHETIQDTHDCYNNSVKFLLEHSQKSDKQVELMCATHNQETIELAIQVMNDLGIDRKAKTICFAQLFGMMDNLTFNLGKNGFRAYKYVPYGEIKMVMPYLVRRANENSSVASGAKKELNMVMSELSRRILGRKISS